MVVMEDCSSLKYVSDWFVIQKKKELWNDGDQY